MTKHTWRIKKEYFAQLKNGSKTLEVRVGYPPVKKIKQGDIITFENYGPNEFTVLRISRYDTLENMLKVEEAKRILPGVAPDRVLKTLQNIYPEYREAFGVYVLELKFKPNGGGGLEFIKASDLLKKGQNQEFSKIVAKSYIITDHICEDYPLHCDTFYSKYIPGIFDGEREIISCRIDGKIVATAFLKKTEDERKLSTLYVLPKYRKHGIATRLVGRCFEWLDTSTPLVTIADYKLEQFSGIIAKYGWRETRVLELGYYNDHSREHVFNE